jgi:arylsulfatase A-like enzyme
MRRVLVIIFIFALTGPSHSQPAISPACLQIDAACREAGFTLGGAHSGAGIMVNCLRPIVEGTAPPQNSSKPLPQIDSETISACRASIPDFRPSIATQLQASTLPPADRPNIVFVLTDDLATNLVQFMPQVLDMQKMGATFTNYFVTDSLCCPSRSSIFTGKYPHNTGVLNNVGPDGGYAAFNARGNTAQTFAVALQTAGYKTALLGKYLNGYEPLNDRVPLGWDEWYVAGDAYKEFNYQLNENGTPKRYGNEPEAYLTDVLTKLADDFIRRSRDRPFFVEIATFAPHTPYTPAPRDADAFPGISAPRTPAFDAAPDANAAKWLTARSQGALTKPEIARIDQEFRKRAQSVLAVDAMIRRIKATLSELGLDRTTYLIFSSDNGLHMGDYRLMPGKMTAYDTDIHVPLIVTGPHVPTGVKIDEITQNIDLCPTFIDLAGMTPPAGIDGRSFVALLHKEAVSDWRNLALIEHQGPQNNAMDPDAPAPHSGNPTTYEAIRSQTSVYIEYEDGGREFHDLTTDPFELRNTYATLSDAAKSALHTDLLAVKNCHGAQGCRSAERGSFYVSRK